MHTVPHGCARLWSKLRLSQNMYYQWHCYDELTLCDPQWLHEVIFNTMKNLLLHNFSIIYQNRLMNEFSRKNLAKRTEGVFVRCRRTYVLMIKLPIKIKSVDSILAAEWCTKSSRVWRRHSCRQSTSNPAETKRIIGRIMDPSRRVQATVKA